MKNILLFLIILLQTALFGDNNPLYEIRGESSEIDANLTQFLKQWRDNTTKPIEDGNYTNIFLHADITKGKIVALTFDDSPDENNTDKVLDILNHYNVKASFFMIGSPIQDNNATVVKRAFDEGHLVLNHSFTHPHLKTLANDEIIQELNATSEKIESITGHYPLLFRPPYGDVNQQVMNTLNTNGYTTILWSLDSLDWAIKNKDAIIENVINHIQPGDIVLMHSSRANQSSVDALPEIIEKLQQLGYKFERLDEMLGIKAYR
ncbi:MAG: polysaccharide deacetylase family protein [Sulfuricurvum sp.]|nr:polysaccharide deacetylase family protein [Sulfuricurvum sp.]